MQINLTGHHVELTDSLRNYVNEKFKRLARHFDHVNNVHVILSVEKHSKKAEASFHLSNNDIFAESNNDDMYAAIDSLVDKLDRQVLKHKEKITSHRPPQNPHPIIEDEAEVL